MFFMGMSAGVMEDKPFTLSFKKLANVTSHGKPMENDKKTCYLYL